MRIVLATALVLTSGCALLQGTKQQDPFPTMQIQSVRPAKRPARVVLTDSSIAIKEKVMFQSGSADILPESHPLLTEVANMLIANPQIELMDIEGHTDSTGGVRINKKLSKERAAAVIDFMVSVGVQKERMMAKGYGPERPIATNESEEGRDLNRRVEFTIVKQSQKRTLVEDED